IQAGIERSSRQVAESNHSILNAVNRVGGTLDQSKTACHGQVHAAGRRDRRVDAYNQAADLSSSLICRDDKDAVSKVKKIADTTRQQTVTVTPECKIAGRL